MLHDYLRKGIIAKANRTINRINSNLKTIIVCVCNEKVGGQKMNIDRNSYIQE